MNSIATHVVKRGMEVHETYRNGDGDDEKNPISPLLYTCLAATFVLFIFASCLTAYTYGALFPALAMVEVPSVALTDSDGDSPEEPLVGGHPKAILGHGALLTSSCTNTLSYLRTIGGRLGPYRGYAIYFVYAILVSQLTALLALVLPRHLATVIVGTGLCTVRMAWMHIIITAPSTKYWFRRLPGVAAFRPVVGVTAIAVVVEQLCVILPVVLCSVFGLRKHSQEDAPEGSLAVHLLKLFVVVVFALGFFVGAVIPANIILARVQASLLAESEETIVNVVREEPLDIKAAWKSLDCGTFVRVVKAFAVAFAIQISLGVLLTVAVIAELALFVGADWKDVLKGLLPPA